MGDDVDGEELLVGRAGGLRGPAVAVTGEVRQRDVVNLEHLGHNDDNQVGPDVVAMRPLGY